MALTAAMKSGPCLCDASATCPRISPLNLGTSYFKDKVIITFLISSNLFKKIRGKIKKH